MEHSVRYKVHQLSTLKNQSVSGAPCAGYPLILRSLHSTQKMQSADWMLSVLFKIIHLWCYLTHSQPWLFLGLVLVCWSWHSYNNALYSRHKLLIDNLSEISVHSFKLGLLHGQNCNNKSRQVARCPTRGKPAKDTNHTCTWTRQNIHTIQISPIHTNTNCGNPKDKPCPIWIPFSISINMYLYKDQSKHNMAGTVQNITWPPQKTTHA